MPAKNDGPDDGATPSKSEQTRALILETAMRLFQERGYDKTTMRAIAKEAGVSVGNAYYYFAGKEHLIQGFYDRIGAEHQVAVRAVLEGETDLEARFAGILKAWLDVAEPYHAFAVRQEGAIWTIAVRRVSVVEVPEEIPGDEVDMAVNEGERAVRVDGTELDGEIPSLEDFATQQFGSFVLRASRLDETLWEVTVLPL